MSSYSCGSYFHSLRICLLISSIRISYWWIHSLCPTSCSCGMVTTCLWSQSYWTGNGTKNRSHLQGLHVLAIDHWLPARRGVSCLHPLIINLQNYLLSCACLLHPKSRNQGKGMLEVPWLAVELREWFASHRLTFPCSSIIILSSCL